MFFLMGPVDSTLVQVMTWHRTGDKPLPEPMITHFSWHTSPAFSVLIISGGNRYIFVFPPFFHNKMLCTVQVYRDHFVY